MFNIDQHNKAMNASHSQNEENESIVNNAKRIDTNIIQTFFKVHISAVRALALFFFTVNYVQQNACIFRGRSFIDVIRQTFRYKVKSIDACNFIIKSQRTLLYIFRCVFHFAVMFGFVLFFVLYEFVVIVVWILHDCHVYRVSIE